MMCVRVHVRSLFSARQVDTLTRQLEEEKQRVVHLKRDMESYKKKTKVDQERAAKMVRV